MFNIDKSIKKIIGTPKQFGGRRDWDGDGVVNRRDCQPRNTMRQDRKPLFVEIYQTGGSEYGAVAWNNINKSRIIFEDFFQPEKLTWWKNTISQQYNGNIIFTPVIRKWPYMYKGKKMYYRIPRNQVVFTKEV